MFCPKCLGETPDDSNRCAKCGELLFARKAAKFLERFKAFPDVTTTVGRWVIRGPVVFAQSGLHFFVLSCVDTRAEQAENVVEKLSEAIGMGGVLSSLMGSGAAFVAEAEGPRPEQFHYRKTELVLQDLLQAFSAAPDIRSCPVFFTLERKEVEALSFSFFGKMSLKAKGTDLSVSGIKPAGEARAFLQSLGYTTG